MSPRVCASRVCSVTKEALKVDLGASGVTKLECDLFRGSLLFEVGSRRESQDWHNLEETNSS